MDLVMFGKAVSRMVLHGKLVLIFEMSKDTSCLKG